MKSFILQCFVLLSLAACIAQSQDAGWRWQNPLPQGNHLRGITYINDTTGIAVGDAGTILRTDDGGNSWHPQRSGTNADLWGVQFVDSQIGTAVGSNGVVLRTTDRGETWTSRSAGTTNTLRAVRFTDANKGIAVEDLGKILKTTDGGETWQQIVVAGTTGLCGVHFSDTDRGTIVGLNGKILKTTDGGTNWNQQNSGTTQHLYAVLFIDAFRGIAVGTGGVILRTLDGGDTWASFTTGTFQPLYSVSFGDSAHGTAVGLPGSNYHTSDGGASWFSRSSGTTNFLWQTAFRDANNGMAVGNNGTIMRTNDGGINWNEQTSGTTATLLGVSFAGVNHGTAVGDLGIVLRTTNAGSNWASQASGTSRTLWSVSFPDVSNGYIVGNNGTILRTANGGGVWTTQPSGSGAQLLSVSASDANNATAVGNSGTILRTTNGGAAWFLQTSGTSLSLNGVCMISATTAVSVGSAGTILRTTNSGNNWLPQVSGTSQNLYGVSFTDDNLGTAVGSNGTILRTTDAGANWMSQSSGTTIGINSVSFISTNVGTAVGYGGLILRTNNSGLTWTPQLSGTSHYLSSIDIADNNNGTTVGFGGTILHTSTGGEPPSPSFSVTPTSIDFGSVLVGENKTDSIEVTNVGSSLLNILDVESDNSRFSVTPTNAVLSPSSSRKFYITFTPASTGPRFATITFTTNANGSPHPIAVQGTGFVEGLGKFLTIPPDTIIRKDAFSGKLLKPVKRKKGLYPNWANLLSEVVVQGGFQPSASESDSAGALRIGVAYMGQVKPNKWKPNPDSASMRCWVRLTRWSFSRNLGTGYNVLQKTLFDKTGTHDGPPRGFDATGIPGEPDRRPLVKQQVRLYPKKHSNALFAEQLALKLNIAASQLGKTPNGFGELQIEMDGHPFDDLSIKEISALADIALTYWQGRPQSEYDSLYSMIYAINRAFLGPLDTLSFEADGELILDGAVELGVVPFLKPGTQPAQHLEPTTRLTEVAEDSDFGEDEFEDDAVVPTVARLYQNYPNPFNPSTTISFRLRESSVVTLKVYDVLGRELATLLEGEELDGGYQLVEFRADRFATGMYVYRLEVESEESGERTVSTEKMMLVK
ncbi:MAG: YCF48-related protein [Bacteroidota bacterium]